MYLESPVVVKNATESEHALGEHINLPIRMGSDLISLRRYAMLDFAGDFTGLSVNQPFGSWDDEQNELTLHGSGQVLKGKVKKLHAMSSQGGKPDEMVSVIVRRVVDSCTKEINFEVEGIIDTEVVFAPEGKASK